MNKIQYVINQINELYQIAIREVNSNGSIQKQPNRGLEKQDFVMNQFLLQKVVCEFSKTTEKCCIFMDDTFVYSLFQIQKNYVILGPIVAIEITQQQNKEDLTKYEITDQTIGISRMSIACLKKITTFAYGLLTEEYDCEEELFGKEVIEVSELSQRTVQEEINQELAEYVLDTSEQEQYHFSFEEEKIQAEHIIQGEHRGIVHGSGGTNVFNKKFIGKMAKTPIKQVEYECVCWITLMTRYAIEAGVSDAKSYALSDVTLQKLSVAKTIPEMEHIFNSSMKEFDARIQEAKTIQGKKSPYMERCKDYIANHIYEKITLEAIADEVGLHPVYLSRLFSENVGMPITNFIMQEKIKLSCNLLKYSGRSIAEIAEYMNLAPQSYYSRVFKKVMNQSPAQYRKEHLDKKFY